MTRLQSLLLSIKVGDAMDGPSAEDLKRDLSHASHDAAAAHYGSRPGCEVLAWERDEPGARAAFEAAMVACGYGPADVALHLAEWDGSIRPVAVIHWWRVDGAPS